MVAWSSSILVKIGVVVNDYHPINFGVRIFVICLIKLWELWLVISSRTP